MTGEGDGGLCRACVYKKTQPSLDGHARPMIRNSESQDECIRTCTGTKGFRAGRLETKGN